MCRLVRVARVLFPVLVAAAAAAVRLQVGETGGGLLLMMLGGALLGVGAALLLESVAVLLGILPAHSVQNQRRRRELQRETGMLLRSLKDIELDVATQKLDPEQGAQLASPLRTRALELLRELQRPRLDSRARLEEQIERELARRLEAPAGGGKQAEASTP